MLVTQGVPLNNGNKEMFYKEYIPCKSAWHNALTKTQYVVIPEVNGNLNEDVCTEQMNFVENILRITLKKSNLPICPPLHCIHT